MTGDKHTSLHQQIDFLKKEQFVLLLNLSVDQKPKWGLMNPQQMVEHLSSLYLFTLGKITAPNERDIHLEKKMYKKLIIEQHPFIKNVKIKGLEKPLPTRFSSLNLSIDMLRKMVDDFFNTFDNDNSLMTWHPLCGHLNRSEWIYIHYLHARHHLNQFDVL